MKDDKGYCSGCNETLPEQSLAHTFNEHPKHTVHDESKVLGVLPMWFNEKHSGPERCKQFWTLFLEEFSPGVES